MRPHLKNKMKLNKIKASGTHMYNKGTLAVISTISTILVELTKFMSLHLRLQNTALLYRALENTSHCRAWGST